MQAHFTTMLIFLAGFMTSSIIAATGKEMFTANKCHQCHGIKSQNITAEKSGMGSDLSTAGAKHDSAWLQKYLKKETELDSKKHLRKPNMSDDDLKALSDWLATLK